MKIHMRFDESNKLHTRFTIFINGQNCGQLCMGTEDSVRFHDLLASGNDYSGGEFRSSGKVYPATQEADK